MGIEKKRTCYFYYFSSKVDYCNNFLENFRVLNIFSQMNFITIRLRFAVYTLKGL